jgi:D-alanine-D-alanine ligase
MAKRTLTRPAQPRLGAQKTLGPVPDLERHLPSEWWRTLFNSLYLKTDGDVVENDINTVKDVNLLIRTAGLEPNDRILDLCCGQGRHCIELARRGFNFVTGLDRSRYLIRLARKRAKQCQLAATFHEGDARKFRFPENAFHCVTLFGNSFGYFEREDDDLAVLERVKRVLANGGMLAMDLVDGDWMRVHFEARSWEWIDENYFVCRERSLTGDGKRLLSREVVVHAERGVIADQFYAERLYSREAIQALLEGTGFERVRDHGRIISESDRGQDLGMMAHRMFLTAQAPRKPVLIPRRGPLFSEVTVLMGDPSLPDQVKRDG